VPAASARGGVMATTTSDRPRGLGGPIRREYPERSRKVRNPNRATNEPMQKRGSKRNRVRSKGASAAAWPGTTAHKDSRGKTIWNSAGRSPA